MWEEFNQTDSGTNERCKFQDKKLTKVVHYPHILSHNTVVYLFGSNQNTKVFITNSKC